MTAVIIGMHRTGSSLIAKASNLLGLDLGPANRLMDAKPDNPTGFWENLDVVGVNDDLLALLGGRWDDPPTLGPGWEREELLNDMRERASEVLLDLGVGFTGILKDPRMSVTLPFWRTVGVFEPAVISVRHPDEVAESLRRRDGMPRADAVDLWLHYTVAACRVAPEALIVDYDTFVASPEVSSATLARHLGLGEPDVSTMASIAEFTSPELRHHVVPSDVEPVPSDALARWLYARLVQAGTCVGLDSFDWSVIDNVHSARRLEWLRRQLVAPDQTIEELVGVERNKAIKAAEAHEQIHGELVRTQADFEDAQREVATHLVHFAEARSEIDDLIRQRDVALTQRDSREDELTGLTRASEEYRSMSRRDFEVVERQNRGLGEQVVALSKELDTMRERLNVATQRLSDLENDWLVRLFRRAT